MIQTGIMLNLVLALAIATAGGALAVWLKRPVIIGYLVAGVILGPFTPGPEANAEDLTFLAEVGVALLLFVTGSSLNPSRFGGLGMVILLGGAIQIVLTVLLGLALMPVLGLTIAQGVLIGAILAQSSSTVIAKLLQDRQEVDSTHGRIALGISVVQDLSSAPLLLLLLVFFGEEVQTVPSFLLAIGEVLLLVAMVYIVGRLIWPRVLGGIERLGSRELALLTTVALALGGGLLVDALGLSFALGAFLAGIVVAESTHGRAAAGRIVPLRDVFAAMFFVFIGTLFDPAIILRAPVALLALLVGAILGKGVISVFVVRLFRSPPQTAMMSGLLLAQIGEFAFILAGIGLERGAISQSLFSLIIAAAALSIFLNSLLVDSAPPVLGSLVTVTGLRPFKKRER